ncbi:hypothetical protein HY639_02100 [Candidatus Woesearchaeota archaeon]|nr:hypothetical protein [Candidatus Woesearchaeota archaeon]
MPLFKKKPPAPKPIIQPQQSPLYTISSIEKRLALLRRLEKKIMERIARFENNALDLQQYSDDTMAEIRRELEQIRDAYKEVQGEFKGLIRALSLTAKAEDFEKTKRFIDQYDPALMMTRKEFHDVLE